MKAKSFVILVVLLALLVTSCAPAATPTPAPKPTDAPKSTVAPTQPAAQSVTLRMAWYNDGNEGEVMRALLDRYEK